MAKREDLTGQIFGDFKVMEYLGNKKWLVQCEVCEETKELYTFNIKKHVGVTCQQKKPPTTTINPGDKFGEWEVLSYEGNKKYLCRCSCGTVKEVLKVNLINGSSTSCGHSRNHYGDLTGKQINEWTVLGKEGYLYKCRCSCGKIQLLGQGDLMSGKSKQCGHGYNIRTDITGQRFGNWQVLEYLGHQMYLCQCNCENHTTKAIRKADLLNGQSTQCGCLKHTKAQETMLSRYGDPAPSRVSNPRTLEQLTAIQSKENLQAFIDRYKTGKTIDIVDLSERLNMSTYRTYEYIKSYALFDKVYFGGQQSGTELSIIKWIETEFGCKVEAQNRSILNGKEIDIYLPEYRVGIEYNGNYWHQYKLKGQKYHQEKSVKALQMGIRLIHIFEYEWKNPDIQPKIKNYLFDILADKSKKKIIYARNTTVHQIKPDESQKFLDAYHIQGQTNAQIHLGIYGSIEGTSEELLGVMTFGTPRFTSNYEYELIRMCFKPRVTVVGGAQKLFSYFKQMYNPKQVISYQDFSKFTGESYINMGLNLIAESSMSEPNYVWVNPNSNKYFKRYSTTKQRLVSLGLGTEQETEDEIMSKHSYLKIYDCGQLRFEYTSKGGMTT